MIKNISDVLICWLYGHMWRDVQNKSQHRTCLRCGKEQRYEWDMGNRFGWWVDL